MTSRPDSRLNPINRQTLKYYRMRSNLTQHQLADGIGCTKDTVSRWERGKTQHVRSHLINPLCDMLRVTPEKLAKPPKAVAGDVTTKVSITKHARASLQIVAERYNVRPQHVLELAPLLFLIVAERSLLERERRLEKIYATLQETEDKLLDNCAHLGGIITARSGSADDQLDQEEESLSKRDVFGRIIKYEYWSEGDEGPFVHFVRDLAKDLPQDAVVDINSFDGDMIESYRIAEDTLRECTGISEDEKQGKELLRYIRYGMIDFAECLRKRNEGEENYRQWLSNELGRAEEEPKRLLQDFMNGIGHPTDAANESHTPENTSEQ